MKYSGNKDKVLVTGGAGFIGSNLCRFLLNQGYEVYAVDNLITGKRKNLDDIIHHPHFNFILMDITSSEFSRLANRIDFTEIYHLACPTGVPNIKKYAEEMIQTCSVGTMQVMEAARQHSAKVLFTSTAEIYGQPEVLPIPEHYNGNVDPLGERSPYEEGKRFSESVIKMYVDKHNVPAKIVRVFNTYGIGMSLEDYRVIPQFLKNILLNKEIVIYGDGEQNRSFLYVDDLINGFMAVMDKGQVGDVYNIGGTQKITMKELAVLMLKLAGKDNPLVFKEHFIEDHKKRQPSVAKVESLGWKQQISLEQGLLKMMNYHGIKQNKVSAELSLALSSF